MAKEVDNGVAPLGHQGGAAEIHGFPAFTVRGNAAPGHGQMNVDVPDQAAAKGVQNGEDAYDDLLFFADLQNHSGRQPGQVVEQVAVVAEQFPECIRHREGDVLPGTIRHHSSLLFDPLVGKLLPTGWAESAFTGKRQMFTKRTTRVAALVNRDAPDVSATGQHPHHVLNNGAAHRLSVFQIEAPPESVAKE